MAQAASGHVAVAVSAIARQEVGRARSQIFRWARDGKWLELSKLICTSAREASRSPTPRAWTTRASLVSGSHLLGIVSSDALTLHFHNTRGLGLVNVMAAFDAGALRFDAALGGLGGYPFAPGSSGNVCTEDLVNLSANRDRDRSRPRGPDRSVARAAVDGGARSSTQWTVRG
ncbi:hypothetical protein [Bradyrhizobium diazoefficiens]|uniref:hypothetical protein n=1 Tax=Bradyrhizobium diazoefficiens TaxID=1355477 RepID=UPI0032DED0F0